MRINPDTVAKALAAADFSVRAAAEKLGVSHDILLRTLPDIITESETVDGYIRSQLEEMGFEILAPRPTARILNRPDFVCAITRLGGAHMNLVVGYRAGGFRFKLMNYFHPHEELGYTESWSKMKTALMTHLP